MRGEKIGVLNNAIQSLILDIHDAADENVEIYIRTMAYNDGQYWMDKAPTPIADYIWDDIRASGDVSVRGMLSALSSELKRFKLNKKNILLIPVLISGTRRSDNYEKEMDTLRSIPVFKKAIKIGVAVGQDADIDLLLSFTGNKELVLTANSLYLLKKLIRWDGDGAWYDDEWAEDASLDTIYAKSVESLSDIISVYGADMVDRIGGIAGSHTNMVGDLWNHSDIEPVEKYDESEPLKTIIKEYSNSIDNIKVMKALLMDFYPNNKLLRNLLMTCVEESILAKLLIKKPVDNMEIYRCEKIIIDSHGCSLDMAKWVIDICIKATNADLSQNEQSKSIESCYDCNLFPKENFEKFFIPVSELDLNSRLYRWLDIMKCFTVRSSVQYDLEFYEKRNNIGDRIINDFCSKLASRGIRIPKNRYEEKIYYYPDEIKNIRICQDEGWEYEYYGMMMLYNLEGLRVYKEYPLDEYTVKHDLKNKSRGTERAFFNLLDEYFDLLCRLYDRPSKCEWDRALGENKSGEPENIEYVVSSLTNNIESLIHWQKKIEFIKTNDYNNSDMIKLLMNLERAFNDDMIIYQRKLLNDVNKVKSYRKHSANPEMSDDPMSLRIDFQFKIMNECEAIKIIVKWIKEQYSGDSTDFFVRSIRKLENVMTLSE